MVEFGKLTAANDVIRRLDAHKIPGEGLSWERIQTYAKAYATLFEEPEPEKQTPLRSLVLSDDQAYAWELLQRWVTTDDPYFVLRGVAGGGKTTMLKLLIQLSVKLFFTAPTNKATKVLARAVGVEAKTVYSTLGIKMTQEEDQLVLKFGDTPPYLPPNSILVVDECSMVGKTLYDFIETTRERTRCKVLYVGDPAQLPPVGEPRSLSWQATKNKTCRAFLKQVMRYDNQLLTLATAIRESIQHKTYDARIRDDNDGRTGVFRLQDLDNKIAEYTNPVDWQNRKVIAWTNKTVNRYNSMIRDQFGFLQPFEKGDILLLAEPYEINGVIVASIDEEFVVQSAARDVRRVTHNNERVKIPVWRLEVKGDSDLVIYVNTDEALLQTILSEKAEAANNADKKHRRELWREFWETKRTFQKVRYGYALTAHRSQGSTYEDALIDQKDILKNENKREALRCLYVASTRATTNIYSY